MKAAANGFCGQLRIALSHGVTPARFSALLALCRQEEPEIEICLSKVPLTQQIKGLRDDLGKSEPTETVESLAANPERLKELRQQCKTDHAKLGDEFRNRVAEATNRRFFGDGKAPYNPPIESLKFWSSSAKPEYPFSCQTSFPRAGAAESTSYSPLRAL